MPHGPEQGGELLAVLGEVDALGRGAEDLHALGDEEVRERYGRVSAEGHDDAHGLFHLDDAHDVLGAERLEVEAGGGVVVCGDRLGVVVYYDYVVAHLAQGLHAVDGAIVELYALADADGAGAEDNDRLAALGALGAGVAVALGHGVEIGRAGLELGGAGIYHLVGERRTLGRLAAGDAADGGVRVAEAAGLFIVFLREPLGERVLELFHALELAQEPFVYAGHVVQGLDGIAGLEGLEEGEDAHVVHVEDAAAEWAAGGGGAVERVLLDLRASHGLHQRGLKAGGDGHYLTRGFHLGTEVAARARKLVEGPLGELYDDIVHRGLEAGVGLAGDLVFDLVKRVAESYLRGDLGYGIAGGLGGEGGGAGDAGIDLDDGIVHALGVERELAVAAALDAELADYGERRGAEHLVFAVGQRQSRCDDDGVARVHADGVDILHAAYGDGAARAVAHDLELYLLPAEDVLLDQHLVYGRGVEASCGDGEHLLLAVGYAAAGAA